MSLLCLRDAPDQALLGAEIHRVRSASDATVVLRRRDRGKGSESSTTDEGGGGSGGGAKPARRKLTNIRRHISWTAVTPAIIQRRIESHGVQGAFLPSPPLASS